LRITFLGTGTSQGVPVIGCTCEVCRSLDYRDKRLRTSILVEIQKHDNAGKEQTFVIDTGPDFRQQMLREHVKRVDAVIFTHAHRDHTAGLDDVRAYNFIQQMDMPVYGTQPVLDQLRIEYAYAFNPVYYPGIPRLLLNLIDDSQEFTINGVNITPLPVMHMRLPVLGFRFGNFSYITDANFIPDETLEKLKGTEILVLNALQREEHISHFHLQAAIDMAKKINAAQTYFTHISHKLGRHALVQEELPATIDLAYDGLQIVL
jgi:phosphoribosyl 1,2-cyclic phosphate phosphodiesterase